ncbi:MAG TPA: hypothetical protein VMD30_09070 [Tepidisphaeraceae bacterium]|nr:hypothetical protein [Tepidisphaeraceae bacterium]
MKKIILLSLAILLARGVAARAVQTSHFTQSNADDFSDGTMHNVVVSNLGDVKLSRDLKTLLEADPRVTTVTALAQAPDGTIYVGTGPQGVLLKISNDQVSTVATLDDTISINALAIDSHGALLIGTGGSRGRVLKIDKPGAAPHEIFSARDVQYVWALALTPDGMLYAATGPNGELYEINPDGSNKVLYKSDEDNLTSLISDGGNLLYIGTDPDGLVIRLNRKTGDWFVLYNAAEEEITSLALDSAGNLYAATGASIEQEQQPPSPVKEPSGRPEATPGSATPIPSSPPKLPPPAPQPTPPPLPSKSAPPIPRNLAEPAIFMQPMPRPVETSGIILADDSGDNSSDADDADDSGDQTDNSDADKSAQTQEGQTQPQGNAIYKIDKDGFVTEVFRENVVIYSMLQSDGVLIVGTGDDGYVYQVDPAAQETIVLAKTDAKEVTAMTASPDGRIILGLSNTGSISVMSGGYAASGTYTSSVFDATQVSKFGSIEMHGSLPVDTALTIATRSGNLKDADAGGWSKWTQEQPAQQFVHSLSPNARFFQYRFTFTSRDGTHTPVIRDMDISYQMPNMAPEVKSVKIEPAPPNPQAAGAADNSGQADSGASPQDTGKGPDNGVKQQGTGLQTITWDASDPNNDALVYTLYFRTMNGGPWVLLKDNLTDTTYNWDTKTVADGRYEVKVVASDALANPPGEGKIGSRISDPLDVDNSPPVIGDLKTTVNGNRVTISVRVVDETSTVASLEYCVDSSDNWQFVLPDSKIWDWPDQKATMVIALNGPGAHQIALRATDSMGNQSIQNVIVNIAAPTTEPAK